MAVNLSPVFGVAGQLFDNNGNPLAGGKIYTYLAGTTTNAATYTNSAGTIAHSNPIVLDGAGRVPSGEIWLTDGITYKFVIEDSASNLIGTYDNLTGINSNFVAYTNGQEIQTATAGQTVFTLTTTQYQPGTNSLSVFVDGVNQYGPGAQYAYVETSSTVVTFVSGLHVGASVKFTTSQLNSSGGQTAAQTSFTGFKGQVGNVQDLADNDGSDWIGFEPTGINSIPRSIQDKLRDFVSVKDFGAIGNGVADDTVAFQDALNAANAGKGKIYVPAGTYMVGKLNWPGNNIVLQGETSGFSYNSSATPKSILKAKAGTTIVLDLVQTGLAEDRTGNVIQDLEVDGNAIALVGIDCAGSNIIERVRVRGCTVAGVRLTNFTNGTRIVRCGLNQNNGWGLQVEGVSTTTFSVTDTNISLNTLGGADIQAGVLVYFQNCIIESNTGPGLYIYKPNTHTNAFEGFLFDNCWIEDNASAAPNFVLVMNAGTSDKEYGIQRVQFRQCRFTASAPTRKYMNIAVAQWVEFLNCQFDNSSQSDAITLASNAWYISFINSGEATGSSGLTATQLDNAMAQANYAWWHDVGVHRDVGAGAPAAAFQNSWANYGSNYTPARYWFDIDGRVCIEGVIASGTIGSVPAFTLPLGYRPTTNKVFVGDGNNSHSAVYVLTTGEVQIRSGSNVFQGINGIVFDRT